MLQPATDPKEKLEAERETAILELSVLYEKVKRYQKSGEVFWNNVGTMSAVKLKLEELNKFLK